MTNQLNLLRRQINQGKTEAIKKSGSNLLAQERMSRDYIYRCKLVWMMCKTDGWKKVMQPWLESLANPFNAYSEERRAYDEKKLLASNIVTEMLLKIESMYQTAQQTEDTSHND